MAKQPKPMPQPAPPRPVKLGGARFVGWLFLLLLVMAVTLPSWIVLVVGFLPTVVALIIDRSQYRYAWLSVGGISLAGMSPYLINLWFGRNDVQAAVAIVTDVFAVFLMFGAAGLGWVLCLAMPPVVGAFVDIAAQRRISELRSTQQRLVSEWGKEVVGGG